MRVQCPDCSIAYDVPDHLLVGRRSLRCARCGAEWNPLGAAAGVAPPTQAEAMPAAEIPPRRWPPPAQPQRSPTPPASPDQPLTPEPFSAMQRLALPVERPRRGPWAGLAWIASLLLLGALGWSAVNWRSNVMHAWPPSTRAYAALGLAPNAP